MADRLFLVLRDLGGRFSSVIAFDADHSDVALNVLGQAEARGIDCVLLGADRLGTLLETHGSWFDEPGGDLSVDELLRRAGPGEAGAP